jgi:hypothetical protein
MIVQGRVIIIVLIITALFTGCAKNMSSEDFAQITAAWGVSMIREVLKNKDWTNNDREREKIAYRKLDEVCKKYGYSAKDYKRKAKELGKRWEEEWRNLWDSFGNH